MKLIEKSGTRTEEIISAFQTEYRIRDFELKYEVVSAGSSGFLGLFGRKKAVLRFSLPEIQDRIKLFLELLLEKMEIRYSRIDVRKIQKTVFLDIRDPEDPGFLIGKNGSMLETIQFIVLRAYEHSRELDDVFVDTQGYRLKKDDKFLSKYLPGINKVKQEASHLTLEPMTSGERRIIHKHIEKDKTLRTLTIGEGEKKRIVIFHSKQKESDVLKQAKGSVKDQPHKVLPRSQMNQRHPKPRAPKAVNKD